MSKEGLTNERILFGLSRYGSNFENKEGGSIISGSGIVSGQLLGPRYNLSELSKGIDTRIRELVPLQDPDIENTISISLYNSLTQSFADITNENINLRNQIFDLSSKVSLLETTTSSLEFQLDSEQLKNGIIENQLTVVSNQLSNAITDLQTSIQSSLAESLSRISLSARNDILESENRTLRDQLFGINTQISKNGVISRDSKFTAKFTGLGRDGDTLTAIATHDGLPNSAVFISSNKLQINNVHPELDILDITFSTQSGPDWFTVFTWEFDQVRNVRIQAQGQSLFDLRFDINIIKTMEPYRVPPLGIWRGKATTYDNTKLNILCRFSDGSEDELVLNSSIQKYRN